MDAADLRALAPLLAEPARSVLLFDFDGTLSPIVERPEDARPGPGVVDLLERLTSRYRRVGVLSGRPVSFLSAHVPAAVDLSGLYGLESRVDGELSQVPHVDRWNEVVAIASERATVLARPGGPLDGVVVEPKGLSLTLHARSRPELEAAMVDAAEALGHELGLDVRPAKRSVELHPPLAVDKGTALEALVEGAGAVLFAGDDVGDLPAFDALDRLGARGVATVGVVVGGLEQPDALARRTGVHLRSQADVVDLLAALAEPLA